MQTSFLCLFVYRFLPQRGPVSIHFLAFPYVPLVQFLQPANHAFLFTGYSGSFPLIHQMLVTSTTATEIHTAEGASTWVIDDGMALVS